jgi:hypothetical protein
MLPFISFAKLRIVVLTTFSSLLVSKNWIYFSFHLNFLIIFFIKIKPFCKPFNWFKRLLFVIVKSCEILSNSFFVSKNNVRNCLVRNHFWIIIIKNITGQFHLQLFSYTLCFWSKRSFLSPLSIFWINPNHLLTPSSNSWFLILFLLNALNLLIDL